MGSSQAGRNARKRRAVYGNRRPRERRGADAGILPQGDRMWILPPLPVLRRRVGEGVLDFRFQISDEEAPPPLPSPGVPGEGGKLPYTVRRGASPDNGRPVSPDDSPRAALGKRANR